MTEDPASAATVARSTRTPGCMLVALVFLTLCVGAAFAIAAATAVQQRVALRRSIPVPAVVESTAVFTENRIRAVDPQMYRPVVLYRYMLNGRSYESRGIEPIAVVSAGSYERARDIAFAYHVGDTITAWVDPARADVAFLQRRTLSMAAPIGIFGFLLLVGWLNVRALRSWRGE